MRVLAHFVVLGPPAVLKNGKKIVRYGQRVGLVSSDRARAYLASATEQIRAQWKCTTLDVQVAAKIATYMPSARRVDLSNSYQAVEDALQAAGVLVDDWQIRSHDGSRIYIDRANPRVEITLTLFEEEEAT